MSVDPQLVVRATGLLRTFNAAGALAAADVHVAQRLGRLGGENDEDVLLAAALAVRAVRGGSVCIDLAQVAATVPATAGDAHATGGDDGTATTGHDGTPPTAATTALPWPAGERWRQACERSPLVAVGVDQAWRPLRLVDGLLYLDRYWQQEQTVRRELEEREGRTPPVDLEVLRACLQRHFPAAAPDRQRLAVALAALRSVTVLAGGPGTGKTSTVARLLAVLHEQPGPPPRVALAAPTGKAAARLQEAVQADAPALGLPAGLTALTLHRLLGMRQDGTRSHTRDNHLPHDVVVVDETSMVSLTLMSRLLEAVRPHARLVLVGDPDQLASVEAGAVLGDLVARPALHRPADARLTSLVGRDLEPGEADSAALRNGVARLTLVHRYGGGIAELAQAVRAGDADTAVDLLRAGRPDLSLVGYDDTGQLQADVLAAGRGMLAAATAGDVPAALAHLEDHRLLCAHRQGPYGVGQWAGLVGQWLEVGLVGQWLEAGLEAGLEEYGRRGEWSPGRPVMVTSNDYPLQLYNGDSGVVVATEDGPRVAFARAGSPLLLSPSRLPAVRTVDAMTVHRGQGSQFARVSVVLPPPPSPLLTRELFYTAVTRARELVRVLGTEQAVRAAVDRPVVRASGLRRVVPPLS